MMCTSNAVLYGIGTLQCSIPSIIPYLSLPVALAAEQFGLHIALVSVHTVPQENPLSWLSILISSEECKRDDLSTALNRICFGTTFFLFPRCSSCKASCFESTYHPSKSPVWITTSWLPLLILQCSQHSASRCRSS